MKKWISLLLVLLLLSACTAFAEGHEHVWTGFTPDADNTATHTGSCACGETINAKHYSFSVNLGGKKSICGVCGAAGGGIVLPEIEDAQAVPTAAKPGKQRGELIVRCAANPFEGAPEVLYVLTMLYENKGGLATFKNEVVITAPVALELPEAWHFVRVSPSAGDDSTQKDETRETIGMTYADGVLSFTSRTPAVYLIIAD